MPEEDRFFINAAGTVLRIGDATSTDRGVYECVAENIAGRKEATAELLVRPPGEVNRNSYRAFCI